MDIPHLSLDTFAAAPFTHTHTLGLLCLFSSPPVSPRRHVLEIINHGERRRAMANVGRLPPNLQYPLFCYTSLPRRRRVLQLDPGGMIPSSPPLR